jgi:basic membrane protein A
LWRLGVVVLGVALVAAACGDDDDDDDGGAATETTAAATSGAETTAASGGAAGGGTNLSADVNGDGVVRIGHVVAGDRADGGFYQGQVDAVQEIADGNGWEDIVVDKVNPGAALETFENLARQSPDLIIAGGTELADGMVPVSMSEEFADIVWVLVAGFPPDGPSYATVAASENQAHYVGGVAMGLLLERRGATTACVVGGPELPFVQNMTKALEAGLQAQNPDAELLVTLTGDFEDANLASEAIAAQLEQGCEVVYPYLGGALGAVVDAGNEADIDVVATSFDRCADTSAEFAMGILYNPSLYLDEVVQAFGEGGIVEGEQFALYGVGDDVGVGAVICDASADEQAALDEAIAGVTDGTIDVNELIEATDS